MIYLFLAEGFEEVEALTPVDLLRRAGKTVVTVGVSGKTVTGARGIPVVADITADEMVLDDALEMVILPGGMPGTLHLGESETVKKAVLYMHERKRLIAAICAAPTVFGSMGLLEGRTATCYPGMESGLTGAKASEDAVCRDGHIITSRGVGTAIPFALALIDALCPAGTSKKIAESVVYFQ